MSFNKILIMGHLGRDPELKKTAQGTVYCALTVATNEKRKDQEGARLNETTWFQVTLWGNLAEVASKYLYKGKRVFLEGRLRAREYTGRDGQARTSLEVTGTDIKLIDSFEEKKREQAR